MKILFVLEHFDPYLGGAEKLFLQVTKLLAEHGHEVTVVTTLFRADLPKVEKIAGATVRRVKCYNRFLFTLFSLPTLITLAKQADLIHTTTYNAAFPAWLTAKIRKKTIVITYHEHWGKLWFRLPFLNTLQRWLYYLFEQVISKLSFDHYIAVSDATKEALIKAGIAGQKITRIYNGINYEQLQQYQAKKTTHFSVIYYGRLGVSKGLDLLIPAWGDFVKANDQTPVELRLILPRYPGKFLSEIKKLINRHCPANSVSLLHELPTRELFTTVKSSHAVVIPSYSEGFCFVAAEAGALGLPIISSGKAALSEVVSGKHLHLEKLNREALREALSKAKNGNWDYRIPEEFSLAVTASLYLEFYNDITE